MKLNLKNLFQDAKDAGLKVTKTELAGLMFPEAKFPLIGYNRLESGRSTGIRFRQIEIICEYLKCEPNDLFINE